MKKTVKMNSDAQSEVLKYNRMADTMQFTKKDVLKARKLHDSGLFEYYIEGSITYETFKHLQGIMANILQDMRYLEVVGA